MNRVFAYLSIPLDAGLISPIAVFSLKKPTRKPFEMNLYHALEDTGNEIEA